MVRVLMILAVTGTAVGSLAARSAVIDDDAIERPFAAGGFVRLALTSGDYLLRAGTSDRIVIRWRAEREARMDDLRRLSVDIHVSGTTALVETDGPARHVRFVVEMPERTNLHLRVRAGNMRIQGIEGDKDIRMTAGDLTIGVQPATLLHAKASVTFGDLDARPLGISKSGIKRSFKWIGAGDYTLDARLFAGDLTLSR